ncbi:helix-turn-helix transcriptional regulator [Nocardia sp. NPDC058705]|uniref:helix-turn-helix transcriptional regulator n=1 Tax=Nocardia sp. NPDC058705 TaxID=3346609 RepID=UPI0036BFE01F
MTKTERLYALAEELRAYSPRPRTARQLAARFEVSTRTIERDLAALAQAGVPIMTVPGRAGGYALDRHRTLAPVSLTAAEATALAVALPRLAGTPFAEAAASAVAKVVAVLPEADRARARTLVDRVRLFPAPVAAAVSPQILESVVSGRVLRLHYLDRDGNPTERDVEPLAFVAGTHWFLYAWCRMRSGLRGFRLDRVVRAQVLDDLAPDRGVDLSTIPTSDGRLIDVMSITDTPLSRSD